MPHSFEFVWILSHGVSWLDWSFVPRKSPCWRHGRRGEARVAHALPWNTFFWNKATMIARAMGKSSVSETTFHWRWQTMCWPSWKTSPRSEEVEVEVKGEVVVIGRHQVVSTLGNCWDQLGRRPGNWANMKRTKALPAIVFGPVLKVAAPTAPAMAPTSHSLMRNSKNDIWVYFQIQGPLVSECFGK